MRNNEVLGIEWNEYDNKVHQCFNKPSRGVKAFTTVL